MCVQQSPQFYHTFGLYPEDLVPPLNPTLLTNPRIEAYKDVSLSFAQSAFKALSPCLSHARFFCNPMCSYLHRVSVTHSVM